MSDYPCLDMAGPTTPTAPPSGSLEYPIESLPGPDIAPVSDCPEQYRVLPQKSAPPLTPGQSFEDPDELTKRAAERKYRTGSNVDMSESQGQQPWPAQPSKPSSAPSSNCNSPQLKAKKGKGSFWGQFLNEIMH